MSLPFRRVLVAKLRGIGDLVLATPALRALRRACPDASVVGLFPEGSGAIMIGNPHLDQLLFYRGGWSVPSLVRSLREERFDLALNLHAGTTSALLTRASGAPERLIHSYSGASRHSTIKITDGPDRRQPAISRDLWALRHLGIEPAGLQTEVFLDSGEVERARQYVQSVFDGSLPLVAIHPGGGTESKRWPVGNYALVAEELVSTGLAHVLMLTDGKEEHLARELQEETSPVIPVASGLPLRKVMALLDRVTLFIGNDSGLLHIAVALGRKTIGLFGPTSAWEWHPYEEARGHAAIQKDVECRGAWCGKQRCDDLACLKKITASEVIAKAREMLANA